uniref:(northern house mosquito) hypothetical protein n=1 Tax=Culex pipiens TaxID=7175 RepID=A0A8D8AGD9_CULPI
MKPGLLQRRIDRTLYEHNDGYRPIGRTLPGLLLVVIGHRGCISGLQNLACVTPHSKRLVGGIAHGLLWRWIDLWALGRLLVFVVRFENLMTLVISGLQNRTPNSSGLVDDGLGRWIALLRR